MSSAPTSFYIESPTDDADFGDVMKWMITVMDRDDTSLHFVASVLSSFLKYNGITQKQAAGIEKIFIRVSDQYARGVLNVQTGGISKDNGPSNVTHINARRKA